MKSIVGFYNKNRHAIWITIAVIILIFGVIKTLNSSFKDSTKDISSSTNDSTTTYNNKNRSIMSGTDVPKEVANESTEIIDSFMKFCNENDIESAYNLLSNDCKETLYPTVEEFKTNYVEKIFTTYRLYDKRAWANTDDTYTYSVKITEDLLSTGGNKDDMNIQDYYTLVKENGEYKLNINSYIGKKEIDKSKTENGIDFYVAKAENYIDYEIYVLRIKNNTKNDILLDSKKNTRTVYLKDIKNQTYIAFLNELSIDDITIKSGMTQTIRIKFNKAYNTQNVAESINFTNIVLKYEDSINSSTMQIKIEI